MTSNASDTESTIRPEWKPEGHHEVAECVRTAVHDGVAINVKGAGTAQCWGGDVDASVTMGMQKLNTVLRYEPGDMTIQVGAGMRVADLQSVVAEHGQRLALDAARIDRGATVGGLVATADQGPGQLAFGGPRDLMIGTGLVFADGSIARSGGHVIKNVAGYDLARLMSGSLGSLAVLTDVTFRLHPVPAATGTLSCAVGIDQAANDARAIGEAGLEPVAVEWISGQLLVRFEGTPTGVQERLAAAACLIGDAAAILTADDSARVWAQHTEFSRPDDRAGMPVTMVRGLVRPTDVPALVQDASRVSSETDALLTVTTGVSTGRVDVRIEAAAVLAQAVAVAKLRQEVERLGGSAILRDRPTTLTGLVDAWGAPPSAVAVLRAVKAAYDPGDVLGRGRFYPWF